jgi:hypothetical protein
MKRAFLVRHDLRQMSQEYPGPSKCFASTWYRNLCFCCASYPQTVQQYEPAFAEEMCASVCSLSALSSAGCNSTPAKVRCLFVTPRFVGIQSVFGGTLPATYVAVMKCTFEVTGFDMIQDMVLLSAPVLARKAGELCGGNFAEVLQQVCLSSWGRGRSAPGLPPGGWTSKFVSTFILKSTQSSVYS